MMLSMQILIPLEQIVYVLPNVFCKFFENNLESEMNMTMS